MNKTQRTEYDKVQLPLSANSWKLTRFFVPLAIQASSQALFYPLVAMVASRGPGDPLNLAEHAIFMATIIVSGFSLHFFNTPGYFIGAIGLTLRSRASSATMRLSLG